MPTLREFLADASASDIGAAFPSDHLSVSQVQMLERCEEQYRERYVLGKKQRPGAALIIGSAFHKAQEANFGLVIEQGAAMEERQLLGAYHAAWDAELDKYGGVNEVVWDKEKPDTVRRNGEEVTLLYASRVAPKYQPTHVEHKFEVVVPGVPVPVVGMVDLLAIHSPATASTPGSGGGAIAADYKTSARAQRTLKPEWKFQGEVYQYAVNRPIEWHVVVKGTKPNVITPADSPDLFQFEESGTRPFVERKFRDAAARIAWLMREYGPDEPWPTTGYLHPWACGFCGFKTDCIAWGRS